MAVLVTLTSEADFLRLIDAHFPAAAPGKLDNLDTVQLGRGDDCAVLDFGQTTCLSSDIFLDNIHFRQSYFSPQDIGHKALAVNISDIAAMGCTPRAFLLDLMVPDGLDHEFWNHLLGSMARLANSHGLTLIGGDISRSPVLGMSIHIWGTPGSSGRLLTRGNARPGDVLATVGTLGLARTGLEQLEKNGLSASAHYPAACAQHLRPAPCVAAGLALASIPEVRGLMDISDGLARDLPRFLTACSGNAGAALHLDPAKIHEEIHRHAHETQQQPEQIPLLGGEDYGLLAAIAPHALPTAQTKVPELQVIGKVTEQPGFICNDTPVNESGFDHFGG